MAVPTSISDLSTTAASNPPAGSEQPSDGDNHIRAAYAFIASLDAGKVSSTSPSFTGNVTASGLLKGNGGGSGLGAITISTSAPSGGTNGDLWFKY